MQYGQGQWSPSEHKCNSVLSEYRIDTLWISFWKLKFCFHLLKYFTILNTNVSFPLFPRIKRPSNSKSPFELLETSISIFSTSLFRTSRQCKRSEISQPLHIQLCIITKLSLKAASNFDSHKARARASSKWIEISGKIPAGASKLDVSPWWSGRQPSTSPTLATSLYPSLLKKPIYSEEPSSPLGCLCSAVAGPCRLVSLHWWSNIRKDEKLKSSWHILWNTPKQMHSKSEK